MTRRPLGDGGSLSPLQARMLCGYILSMTTLAFYARAMAAPFLPLVLEDEFGQGATMIGLATAVYPLAALLATPLAGKLSRATDQILWFHSFAVLAMACALLIFSTSMWILSEFGPSVAFACVIAFRIIQGASFAMYIAANTALVTRYFPLDVPYLMGLLEVAVGVGGQLGRLLGGFLYEKGGLPCPFYTIAVAQALWACFGFFFRASPVGVKTLKFSQGSTNVTREVPWLQLLTPRTIVGLFAVNLNFFQAGFNDATLSPYLMHHLHLDSVGIVSSLMALRSLMYLVSAYGCAGIMRSNAMCFERMITIGSAVCALGFFLLAPQPVVPDASAWLASGHEEVALTWVLEIFSTCIISVGTAMLFLPSLPLMQAEARQFSEAAVEQTASLWMGGMSVGEAAGPILGGWLVESVGYVSATAIFVLPYCLQCALALATFDDGAVRLRLKAAEEAALASAGRRPLLASEGDNAEEVADPSRLRQPFVADEGASLWRCVATKVELPERLCWSDPATTWRRAYQSDRRRLYSL
eukprot:TRINITY_DN7383_c0_g1_i1.p1 TRINITY_DN7383_c0_g1~~TRINITY_DN7383_c0_g1_i1.p1  ORF type:complete len:564 (+),score=100.36 TRINITY_DN7383_c0_g1_i1:114-1694(+)